MKTLLKKLNPYVIIKKSSNLLLILTLMFHLTTLGNITQEKKTTKIRSTIDSWILAKTSNGVSFYINYDQCNVITLKIVNINSNDITVRWSEKIMDYTTNTEIIINNGLKKSINVKAFETLQATCNNSLNALKIDTTSLIESIGDGSSDFIIAILEIIQN